MAAEASGGRPDLVVRPAERRELGRIAALLRAEIAASEIYGAAFRAHEQRRMSAAFLEEVWAIDQGCVMVGLIEGEIAAFSVCSLDNGIVWMHWGATLARFRRFGTALRASAAMVERFRGRCFSKLCTVSRIGNRRAEALLRRSGFRAACELRNHWFGEDFILWELPLDPVEPYVGQTGPLPLRRRLAIRLRHALGERAAAGRARLLGRPFRRGSPSG